MAGALNALQTLLALPTFEDNFPLLTEEPPVAEPGTEFETKDAYDEFISQKTRAYQQLLVVPVDDVSNPAYSVRPIALIQVNGHRVYYLRQQQGGQLLVNPLEAMAAWNDAHIAFMSRWHRFYCAMHNRQMGQLTYAGMPEDLLDRQMAALLMDQLPN